MTLISQHLLKTLSEDYPGTQVMVRCLLYDRDEPFPTDGKVVSFSGTAIDACRIIFQLKFSGLEIFANQNDMSETDADMVNIHLTAMGPKKIHQIKEVRALTGMALEEAKDLVERVELLVITISRIPRIRAVEFLDSWRLNGGEGEIN